MYNFLPKTNVVVLDRTQVAENTGVVDQPIEALETLADLIREHGFSEQSFYRWKSKFGGMEVSDAKHLRELEAENARLKKLLAEAELDKAMLKDVLGRKW